jgi:hypothetical protein
MAYSYSLHEGEAMEDVPGDGEKHSLAIGVIVLAADFYQIPQIAVEIVQNEVHLGAAIGGDRALAQEVMPAVHQFVPVFVIG